MSETYTVVLLVEQALSAADAAQVRSLHEGLDDPRCATTCCCRPRTPRPASRPRWARSAATR